MALSGEVLGPLKAPCHSVGKCKGGEAGVGGLVSRGRGKGREVGGEMGKGDKI